jgi:hypothetical protein
MESEPEINVLDRVDSPQGLQKPAVHFHAYASGVNRYYRVLVL